LVTRLTKSPPVALLGEQAPPRVLVLPDRSVANDWEDVADLSAGYGLSLDGWQEDVLRAAMGVRSDGTWAAKQIGVSAPRQNGKSQLIVARALAGALVLGEKKIIISAHQQDTARETFAKFLEMFDANDLLRSKVKQVMNALNREFIKFTNGAEIRFKARSTAGGRGFSSDLLLLDEAQILGMPAWVSINSTMSARPNPQIWLLGTPPTPEDNGEVFTFIRDAAMAGRSSALAYLEWSAEPDDDPALAETRAKANPAWHTRINHDVVQGEFETYPAIRFAMDRLGIWATELEISGAISSAAWGDLAVDEAPAGDLGAFAVAFSADGMRYSVAGALTHGEEAHVELISADVGSVEAGLAPLADWFTERVNGMSRWRRVGSIVISGRSGASVLAQLLRDRGVPERKITLPSTSQYFEACGALLERCRQGTVTHLRSGQDRLDESVLGAIQKQRTRDGAWGWDVPGGDETPVEAVSLALLGARTPRRGAPRRIY
jgi:hypothetical protein